tara:strand:- start:8637 stop:9536 length:900 start_codon:yes stop_codon:yes gene_type:complete
MLKTIFLFFLIGSTHSTFCQQLFLPSDSLNNKRVIAITSSVSTVWASSIIGLSQIWYKDIPKSKFQFFNDNKEWLQMDKVGHFYTAYKINKLTSDLYRWSGVSKKTSLIIGTGISVGYQSTFEILDGYSKNWGFSWGDVGANTLGSLSFLGQELAWGEERIIPKFSALPTKYASIRPAVLGRNFTESLLKDYNGQTYWLSFSPGTFFKNSKIPKWACLSIGYSVDAKLIGNKSSYTDVVSGITYNEKREFLLSLDIDFSRLPIKRPWLKAIVKQFNYLKIPFPSLMLRGDQLVGSWSGY